MTRLILVGLAAGAAVVAIAGTGCQESGIGDPCTPEEEYKTGFSNFTVQEVVTEAESFQCRTRLCLVNHFQGRVSCPYGQNAQGNPNPPANQACQTPSVHRTVTGPLDKSGNPVNPKTGKSVLAQCVDRTAADTVYCSCRCADLNGGQSGNGTYCTCPSGFTCTQLVRALSSTEDPGLVGAYCIKDGTAYSSSPTGTSNTACAGGECGQLGSGNCGSLNNDGT